MASSKLLLPSLLLSLLALTSIASTESWDRRHEARQCRLNRLATSRPSRRIESEGGTTELWDEELDEFQCAGVAAMRNTIRPNSLSLPNYHPAPRLVYIERGRGLLGISYPGCPETFQSEDARRSSREGGSGSPRGSEERRDQHQKVHQIEQGDIVVLPAGATHYCINDGNEDLVAVSVTDLENNANQLDNGRFRQFYLAGGIGRESRNEQQHRHQERFQNVIRDIDDELLAEAFNVPVDVARRMKREDNRGFIVRMREGWSVARPRGDREERQRRDAVTSVAGNEQEQQNPEALEGAICSAKIFQNIDNERDAYVYASNAGRLNVASRQTLPILRNTRMSAEKLKLQPDAQLAPHYSMNGHTVVYVTRGEARVQISGMADRAAMDQTVRQGDMFVIPQYAMVTIKAGRNGYERVAFKTTSQPSRSPLAGHASIMRGIPATVIASAYRISTEETEDLKQNRRHEALLLSPTPLHRDLFCLHCVEMHLLKKCLELHWALSIILLIKAAEPTTGLGSVCMDR